MKASIYLFTGGMFVLACALPWFATAHWYHALAIDVAILFLSVGSAFGGAAASSRY